MRSGFSPSRCALPLAVFLAGAAGCKNDDAGRASKAGAGPSASATVAPVPPREVSLRVLPATVGASAKIVRKSTLGLSVEFWKEGEKLGTNESTRAEAFARTTEVLGLLGGAPGRVRSVYDRYSLSERRSDKPPREDGSLQGRSFVLDATEGRIVVSAADGKPLTPEQDGTLKTHHADLGKDDPVVAALGSRPIPVGRAFPIREPLFKALLGAAPGTFKGGTITLTETRTEGGRETARFEWNGEMTTQEDDGLEVTWRLKGDALVAIAPAFTLRSATEASLDAKGRRRHEGAWVELQGAGSMQDDLSVSPL